MVEALKRWRETELIYSTATYISVSVVVLVTVEWVRCGATRVCARPWTAPHQKERRPPTMRTGIRCWYRSNLRKLTQGGSPVAHPAMLGRWPSTSSNTATTTPCTGSLRHSRSGSEFPKPSTVMPRTPRMTATDVLWPSMTERPWESFSPDATSPNPRRSTSWPSIRTCVGPVLAGVSWNGWWTICPPMAARCSPCTRWGRPSRTAPYAQTRAFYTRMGFLPLEEHEDLEWPGPTLILVRALPATGRGHAENQDHTQGTSAPPTNGAGGVGESEMSGNRWGP